MHTFYTSMKGFYTVKQWWQTKSPTEDNCYLYLFLAHENSQLRHIRCHKNPFPSPETPFVPCIYELPHSQVNVPRNRTLCLVNFPRLHNKNTNEFPRNCLFVQINGWSGLDSNWEVSTTLHTKNRMTVQKKPSWNTADLVTHLIPCEWKMKLPSPTRKLVGVGQAL